MRLHLYGYLHIYLSAVTCYNMDGLSEKDKRMLEREILREKDNLSRQVEELRQMRAQAADSVRERDRLINIAQTSRIDSCSYYSNPQGLFAITFQYSCCFEGRIWDLIVSVPDHCLSFYFR